MFSVLAQAAASPDTWDQVVDVFEKAPTTAILILLVLDKWGNNSERNYLRAKDQRQEETISRQAETISQSNAAMAHAIDAITQFKPSPK